MHTTAAFLPRRTHYLSVAVRRERRALTAVVLAASLGCILYGALIMVAWHRRTTGVLTWPGNVTPVPFNTALAITVTGAALLAITLGQRWPAVVAGVFDMALGLLVLAEHGMGRGLGMDELFVRAYLAQPGAAPGRMAVNTAVCLVLVGGALLVGATMQSSRVGVELLVTGCAVASIAALTLFGHVTNVRAAAAWGRETAMEIPTAIVLMLIAAAVVTLAWESAPRYLEWVAIPAGAVAVGTAALAWLALGKQAEDSDGLTVTAVTRAFGILAVIMAGLVGIIAWLALRAERRRRLAEAETALRAATESALRTSEARLTRRNAELEAANRELDRSNTDLEMFAYAASHDLAEPLRAISGPLTVIANRYQGRLDTQAEQFIGFAVDGCLRMQDMIACLLEFSRVGRVEGAVVPTDAEKSAYEAVAALRELLENSHAEIAVESLPMVMAEPHQLAMVFQNLLSNAVKFVAPGVVPHVTVSAERAGGRWRISLTDNGIGIPVGQRAKVFGVFKRLHAREDYPGSGIGLALVKKIVERHGGEVGIEDAPTGTGCRIWFTLSPA